MSMKKIAGCHKPPALKVMAVIKKGRGKRTN
jgi:hypothetical protein